MLGLSDATAAILITGIISVVSLVITNIFQLYNQGVIKANQHTAETKLTEIHVVANSTLANTQARLDTALAVIAELNKADMVRLATAVPPPVTTVKEIHHEQAPG